MKSTNISSATGRKPAVAAPIAAPTNPDSLIGVSSTRVTETGLLEVDQLDAIDKEVDGHIAGALAKAKAAAYPKPEALFTDVYAAY